MVFLRGAGHLKTETCARPMRGMGLAGTAPLPKMWTTHPKDNVYPICCEACRDVAEHRLDIYWRAASPI